MRESPGRQPSLAVVNYDALQDYEPRVQHLGRDVELPGRGVPQRAIFYGAALLALLAALSATPGIASILAEVPGWARMLVLPVLGGLGAATINVEGLALHQLAAPVARNALMPRHMRGWVACEPLDGRWRPAELTLLADGSEPRLESGLRYTGPGVVLRYARTTSRAARPRLRDRLTRREIAVRTFTLQPGRRPGGPQRITVPARVTVAFLGEDGAA